MTTIEEISDNAGNLRKAVGRLARAGFEDAVHDEAIAAGHPGDLGAMSFSPGLWFDGGLGQHTAALPTKPRRHSVVQAGTTAMALRLLRSVWQGVYP